jgi:hypothetical protein
MHRECCLLKSYFFGIDLHFPDCRPPNQTAQIMPLISDVGDTFKVKSRLIRRGHFAKLRDFEWNWEETNDSLTEHLSCDGLKLEKIMVSVAGNVSVAFSYINIMAELFLTLRPDPKHQYFNYVQS